MQIRRFYSPELSLTSQQIVLSESESLHVLRVLRLRPGDKMLLMNGKGLMAEAELSEASNRKQAVCRVSQVSSALVPDRRLVLYVAPPHTKSMELILKMAVELGVWRIVPIICRNSVSKPDETPENWNNIVIGAMKQSINPWLPEIVPPLHFLDAVRTAPKVGCFGATPGHNVSVPTMKDVQNEDFCVWVGPEGGFVEEEESALLCAGQTPVSVGNYVLRVETAVPALIALAHKW